MALKSLIITLAKFVSRDKKSAWGTNTHMDNNIVRKKNFQKIWLNIWTTLLIVILDVSCTSLFSHNYHCLSFSLV